MRHPVSTSLRGSLDGAEVKFGVVPLVIEAGAPDHTQPGASEDANGMRVIAAALAGSHVDAASPAPGRPKPSDLPSEDQLRYSAAEGLS